MSIDFSLILRFERKSLIYFDFQYFFEILQMDYKQAKDYLAPFMSLIPENYHSIIKYRIYICSILCLVEKKDLDKAKILYFEFIPHVQNENDEIKKSLYQIIW